MRIDYCEKWFSAGKRPIKPLSEAEARRRHGARTPYTALIGGQEAPSHVISIAADWVSVGFLDRALREYLSYSFQEMRPGKLFLVSAGYRDFEEGGAEPVTFAMFSFKESGELVVERRDLRSSDVQEVEHNVDVSSNWEEYPEFGEYGAVKRAEREIAR